jgi:hypothetical protein
MAPSNLNQVFIANTGVTPAIVSGTTFSQSAVTASATRVGLWDLAGGTYATDLALTTPGVLNPAIKQFQVTQTMLTGNCIATPIIDLPSIKRLAFTKFRATTLHQIQINLAGYAATANVDDGVMFRIALRTPPTSYLSYTNPSDTTLDLSATASAINGMTASTTLFPFPLVGNFSAGRMIFNVEVTEAALAAGGITVANLQAEFAKAFTADKLLGKLFTVDTTTTANAIVVTARHAGVIFDMTIQSGNTSLTSADVTVNQAGDAGSGNYWQVLSEEKAQRSRYGNFNRMYFPMSFPEFAIAGNIYDMIQIDYEHGWPSSTGIAKAGELNTVRIYSPSATNANTNIETKFGFVAFTQPSSGATVEYLY